MEALHRLSDHSWRREERTYGVTFAGVFNSIVRFTERSTGAACTLRPFIDGVDTAFEPLDAHENAATDSFGQRQMWAIRERGVLRRE